MQPHAAPPVEQDYGIEGLWIVLFQKRDADGHLQLTGQGTEGTDKFTVFIKSQSVQLFRILREVIAVTPHFREQGNVGSHLSGLSAGIFPLSQLPLQILFRHKL